MRTKYEVAMDEKLAQAKQDGYARVRSSKEYFFIPYERYCDENGISRIIIREHQRFAGMRIQSPVHTSFTAHALNLIVEVLARNGIRDRTTIKEARDLRSLAHYSVTGGDSPWHVDIGGKLPIDVAVKIAQELVVALHTSPR